MSSQACGPAPPEAVYSNLELAFTAIQAHARDNGYAFRKYSRKANRAIFWCDRGGKYDSRGKDPSTHPSRQRETGSKKCGCQMRVELCRDAISNTWRLAILEASHNHGRSADPSAHPAHRIASFTPAICDSINTFGRAGASNSQIVTALKRDYPGISITLKDVANILQKSRLQELAGKTPIQWLIEVLIYLFYLIIY
jgi:hypothetical protein